MSKVSNNQKGATRKVAVKKNSFRLRIKHFLVLVCLGGFAFVIRPLVGDLGDFFDRPLQGVNVAGDFTYINAEEIELLIEEQIVDGVLMTDLQHIQATLLAQPWVRQASVRRQWPGYLEVWLAERVPVAKFNNALLSSQAHIFRPAKDFSSLQLPRLTGSLGGESVIWTHYQWLQRLLQGEGLEIELLSREDRGAWSVTLAGGNELQLYLGREDFGEKIERFLALYRYLLKEQIVDIERIDLRYPHGVAVRWKQAQTQGKNT